MLMMPPSLRWTNVGCRLSLSAPRYYNKHAYYRFGKFAYYSPRQRHDKGPRRRLRRDAGGAGLTGGVAESGSPGRRAPAVQPDQAQDWQQQRDEAVATPKQGPDRLVREVDRVEETERPDNQNPDQLDQDRRH